MRKAQPFKKLAIINYQFFHGANFQRIVQVCLLK
jgi:hypothetical protein